MPTETAVPASAARLTAAAWRVGLDDAVEGVDDEAGRPGRHEGVAHVLDAAGDGPEELGDRRQQRQHEQHGDAQQDDEADQARDRRGDGP